MNLDDLTVLLLLVVPAIIVWLLVSIDILRSKRFSARARIGWLVAVTLIPPASLLYLLTRPTPTPEVADRLADDDPRVLLVSAVVEHDLGDLDRRELERVVANTLGS